MTQEDKELLSIDLCARLPYYPYALFDFDKKFDEGFRAPIIGMVNKGNTGVIKYNQEFYAYGCMVPFSIEEFRIYLRPMSSITKEELYEVQEILGKGIEIHDVFISIVDSSINTFSYLELQAVFDWFNAHHFDYRGLIEKGLALEAPEVMYKHFGDMDVVVTSVEYKHKL